MQSLIRVLLLLMLAVSTVVEVDAQTTAPQSNVVIKKSQLLVRPRDANGNLIVTPFFEDPVQWARDEQQVFYGTMSTTLHALRAGSSSTAAWTLMALGFGYGVFHAAGPGHGKVVISSWLLATENDLKRGLLVAFFSSMFQAVTAIVLVSLLLLIVAGVGGVIRDVTSYLEATSYAMICLLGLYLMWTAMKAS